MNTRNLNYFPHLTTARESRLGNDYFFGPNKNLRVCGRLNQGTNFVQF